MRRILASSRCCGALGAPVGASGKPVLGVEGLMVMVASNGMSKSTSTAKAPAKANACSVAVSIGGEVGDPLRSAAKPPHAQPNERMRLFALAPVVTEIAN